MTRLKFLRIIRSPAQQSEEKAYREIDYELIQPHRTIRALHNKIDPTIARKGDHMPLSDVLLSSSGRIPRSTYWIYGIAIGLLSVLASFLDVAVFGNDQSSPFPLFSAIVSLLSLVPGIMVSIKRCHDRNHSGWFLLILFIPLVNLWPAVELAFIRGTDGDNEYGPDPLRQGEFMFSSR